jgi:hypothetical protein
VEVLGGAEIELRIALLPPISRGAHLAGPRLHAERRVELWKADGEVALAEVFRLLDVETVAGVILRTVTANEYEGDPRHWHFPPFIDLLPPLRAAAWQALLDGRLVLMGVKGITGRRHQPLAPALLPRLTPDWELSRLMRAGQDAWFEVRVRPIPAIDIPRPWQPKPAPEAIEFAAKEIAEAHPPPDGQLSFANFWAALKAKAGVGVSKRQALAALNTYAPHLRGQPGIKTGIKIKSPS